MTRDEILRATQVHFDELFGVWSANADRKGMGALVFISEDHATALKKIDFRYLTLGELGGFLMRLVGDREFVHRVVRHAERARGMPVVIIPPWKIGQGKFSSATDYAGQAAWSGATNSCGS